MPTLNLYRVLNYRIEPYVFDHCVKNIVDAILTETICLSFPQQHRKQAHLRYDEERTRLRVSEKLDGEQEAAEREWPVSFKALLDGFDVTILMSMATIELLAKAEGAALEQHFAALMVRRDADEWESFLGERERRRALKEQREIERARRRAEKAAWEEERAARREDERARRRAEEKENARRYRQYGHSYGGGSPFGGFHGVGFDEEDFIEMMFARRFGAFFSGGHGFSFGGGGHSHFFVESDDEDDDYWEREREEKAREARETTRKSTEILGVDEEATTGEIKSAYRAKARLYHPDKWHLHGVSTGLTQEQTVEHFRKLQEAYEYLSTEN